MKGGGGLIALWEGLVSKRAVTRYMVSFPSYKSKVVMQNVNTNCYNCTDQCKWTITLGIQK